MAVVSAVPLGAVVVALRATVTGVLAASAVTPARMANLTEPSGQRFLTSACTLAMEAATKLPLGTSPRLKAKPKVKGEVAEPTGEPSVNCLAPVGAGAGGGAGVGDGVGPGEGAGTGVGDGVGEDVGAGVGDAVGDAVGDGVGDRVGDGVGDAVGAAVGTAVADGVGAGVRVGTGVRLRRRPLAVAADSSVEFNASESASPPQPGSI